MLRRAENIAKEFSGFDTQITMTTRDETECKVGKIYFTAPLFVALEESETSIITIETSRFY